MESFLEVDNLNLGGHRRIAVQTSGETNQYIATARCLAGVDRKRSYSRSGVAEAFMSPGNSPGL